MKSYQNPQPGAVESANKTKNKRSGFKDSKTRNHAVKSSQKKSNKEIFQTESEEQAWKDALEKDK